MNPDRPPGAGGPAAIRPALSPLLAVWLAACAAGGGTARAPSLAPSGPASREDTATVASRSPGGDSNQVDYEPSWSDDPCLVRLSERDLTRRDTVYLHAFILGTAGQLLLPQADLLAQVVAGQLLRDLGGRRDALPTGEPRILWINRARGNVLVMAHRDGRATWKELAEPPYSDTAALHELAVAVARAADSGSLATWRPDAGPDSVEIRLAFDSKPDPRYDRGIGLGFPIFAQRAPAETRPRLLIHPPLHYPAWLRDRGVTGHVVLEVIIDQTGHAEPGSVHDVWPPGVPHLEATEQPEYDAFVQSARTVLVGASFSPGLLGSCPVRVRVRIPFNFQMSIDE